MGNFFPRDFVFINREMFKRKSECQKIKGLFSPYIDGQLSPSDVKRVESHVEECSACRHELESLRAVVGLLHRVPMISPRRSFAIAARVPRRSPVALRALRVATAVAVLLLAFVFMGDMLHFFEPGRVEDRAILQEYAVTSTPNGGEVFDTEEQTPEGQYEETPGPAVLGEEGLYSESEAYESSGSAWPVRPIELALVGVVVVLGGATAIMWLRIKQEKEKLAEALIQRKGGNKK
jgi:hypothetical protein